MTREEALPIARSNESPLLAWHGDAALKKATVAEMAEHRKADRLFLQALAAGVVAVDFARGIITGTRWGASRQRGTINKTGYIVFTLHFAGERVQVKAHRAVLLAANGPISEGLIPDHINRDRADNRLVNLRLVTTQGNSLNRRNYNGEQNPAARLTAEEAAEIRRLARASRGRRREIAARFGVSESLVCKIAQGRMWA